MSAIPRLGPDGAARLASAGERVDDGWRVLTGVVTGRVRLYFGEVIRQAVILARGSSLIILAEVFAFGLVIGVQAAYGARFVGAPSAAGAFTAIADLREIAPYAFGYMMAAKVSTGYVAEIGTMRINDEVDALDVMGIDSLAYLGSTRLLAAWLVLPLLYGVAVLAAFVASFLSVVVQIHQVSAGGYLELFWKFQDPQDLLFSGAKAMAMGTFVVLVGVVYGYRANGGPVGVGTATARAMIINIIGVHVIGILGSQIFWGGTPRLPIGG